MLQSDFQRFKDLMRGMGRVFNSEPDALVLDVYWLSLRTWAISDFESAVAHLMANATFMPRPADFTKLRKAGEPTAGEAWQLVLKQSLDWRNPQPDSRVLRAANAVGGLHAIAMANIERDIPFIEQRFKVAYEELDRVEPIRDALPQIARPAIHVAGLKSLASTLPQLSEPSR
jgi:hypothetical protein